MRHLPQNYIKEINMIFSRDRDVYLDQNGTPIAKNPNLMSFEDPLYNIIEASLINEKKRFEVELAITRLCDYKDNPELLYKKAFTLLSTLDPQEDIDLPINILALDRELRENGISDRTQKLYQLFGEACINRLDDEGLTPLLSIDEVKRNKVLSDAFKYEQSTM